MTDEWVLIDGAEAHQQRTGDEREPKVASKRTILSIKTKGNKQFNKRKYGKAITFYTEAIDKIIQSESAQRRHHDPLRKSMVQQWQCLLSNRAKAYNQLHRYQEAVKDLTECIQLRPTSLASNRARYTRSEILYIGLHDAKGALADCCRILRKEKSGILSKKFIGTVSAWKSKILREAVDQTQYDLAIQIVELESDLRSEIMRGPIPIAMSTETIKGAMFYGADSVGMKGDGQEEVLISCHRCGSTAKDRYLALDTEDKRRISLECIDCSITVARQKGVGREEVSQFVGERYLGACEACSYIQGS